MTAGSELTKWSFATTAGIKDARTRAESVHRRGPAAVTAIRATRRGSRSASKPWLQPWAYVLQQDIDPS